MRRLDEPRRRVRGAVICLAALALARSVDPAEAPQPPAPLDLRRLFQEGIPPAPFLAPVTAWGDAIVDRGRDIREPVKTGLFLGALDRRSLEPLDRLPPPPAGVRPEERPGPAGGPPTGANALRDHDLFRLLLFLRDITGQEKYSAAVDEALRWLLDTAPSPTTGLLPWGRTLAWDAGADVPVSGLPDLLHEPSGPWLLWARCFELAPDASRKAVTALRDRHLDGASGRLAARAGYLDASLRSGEASPRVVGFLVRAWAEAHAATGDGGFLVAVEKVLETPVRAWIEGSRGTAATLPPNSLAGPEATPAELLSLAVDLDGASARVPEPLRGRLARAAARLDAAFLAAPNDIQRRGGFATRLAAAARSEGREAETGVTPLWDPREGGWTTARVAAICVSRHENGHGIAFRDLVVRAADRYMDSLPEADTDAWPGTFGHVISVELAAFRAATRAEYLLRAQRVGEIALERFFDGSPLPRASLRSEHYESGTGAATLALALVDLHLTIRGITAVRTPPNVADR